MITMHVADEDTFEIPQNLPYIIAILSVELTPGAFTSVKENITPFRDLNKCPRHLHIGQKSVCNTIAWITDTDCYDI
jgi:hypothetical protein